jgi:hypothetical protein
MTELVRIPISPEARAKILQIEPRARRDIKETGGIIILSIGLETFQRLVSVQAKGESMESVILSAIQNEVMTWQT